MRVEIDTAAIVRNIDRARKLTNVPISLMFKDFYEDIFKHIDDVKCKIFSKSLADSICYSLGNATQKHNGCLVTTCVDYLVDSSTNGIYEFYIPINAHDNREGLSVEKAVELARYIQKDNYYDISLYGLITSGCLNEKHPSIQELDSIWEKVSPYMKGISLGGSFWLSRGQMPSYVSDIRIGEYMLFGTIPFDDRPELRGENAIKVKSKVLGVYPDRKQMIIDCGYSLADVKDCTINHPGIKFVDSSSEYSIFDMEDGCDIKLCDEIEFIPNYKSLVKLKDAERHYL